MIHEANGVASANPIHYKSQVTRSAAWPGPPPSGPAAGGYFPPPPPSSSTPGRELDPQQVREPLRDITLEVYPPEEEAPSNEGQENGSNAGGATADSQPSREGNMRSPSDDVVLPSLYDYQYRRVEQIYSAALNAQRADGQSNEPLGGRNVSPPIAGPSRASVAGPARASGGMANTPMGPPPPPSNLETIRANMAKLLDDGPMSDQDFANMHYNDGAETARIQQAMQNHAMSQQSSYSSRPAVPQHTQQQFLDQRAASSSHSLHMGETPPSYAFRAPEPPKKKKTPGQLAAQAMTELDKANKDFERNLKRNFGSF
jgi:hypothetical protein